MNKLIIEFEKQNILLDLNDISSVKQNKGEHDNWFLTFYIKATGYISVKFDTKEELDIIYTNVKSLIYKNHVVISANTLTLLNQDERLET